MAEAGSGSLVRSLSLAAVAGGAIAAGGAPINATLPSMLAPGLLLLALSPRRGAPLSPSRAALVGLAFGVTVNTLTMYWVVGLLIEFARFPLPLAVLVGALLWVGQSLAHVAGAWLAASLLARGLPAVAAVPCALTLAESLAPKLFPWHFGLSQLPHLAFVQVAELGGMPLVDLLLAGISCAAVVAVRDRARGLGLASAAVLAVVMLYGHARVAAVEAQRAEAPALRVGVVQPNVGIHEKRDPRNALTTLAALHAETRALEARGAELVLWPESSYPFPVPRARAEDREGPLAALGDGVRGPLLFGVITTDGPTHRYYAQDALGRRVAAFEMGTERRFNSAIALRRGGAITGRADKIRLLAFGEYTPLWEELPALQRFPRGISPGRGSQTLAVAGSRVAVLNCYEDLLSDYVRDQVRGGAPDWLANLTNNAWFGDTSAPHLHHMNARMRAIETRRDLVRAVNTGVSGHVSATGEDLVVTGTFEPARFVTDVRRLDGSTPYVLLGDWVPWAILGGLGGALLAPRRRRRGPSGRR